MTLLRHLALRGSIMSAGFCSHSLRVATRSTGARNISQHLRRAYTSDAPPSSAHPSVLSERDHLSRDNDLIQAYRNRNTTLHTTSKLGSELEPHYRPNDLYVHPPSATDVTVELLLASQAHLGHSTALWNPANSRYIFGVREGIHIISLDITAAHLRRAARVVTGVAERGGITLFVGTRKGHERTVVRAAELAGGCHLFERWIPGTLTNGEQILAKCSTKVVDEFDQEMHGFENQLAEIPVLKPDLVVVFNPLENQTMLHECGMAGIPTIGIVDTDVDPTWVTYPIPANDDSVRSVATIGGVLGMAGQEGQQLRRDAAKQGKVTYSPPQSLHQLGVEEEGNEDSDDTGWSQDPSLNETDLTLHKEVLSSSTSSHVPPPERAHQHGNTQKPYHNDL